ncbi:hypothetical protein HMI56_005748 [Coelomomyces lativittatus]|nr:hypothetical protein HMI56_005748 [Coelomomyces lativittatus]
MSFSRSHTGERPYDCPAPECDKSFTRSDALAKHHKQQHTQDPPPLLDSSSIDNPTEFNKSGTEKEGLSGSLPSKRKRKPDLANSLVPQVTSSLLSTLTPTDPSSIMQRYRRDKKNSLSMSSTEPIFNSATPSTSSHPSSLDMSMNNEDDQSPSLFHTEKKAVEVLSTWELKYNYLEQEAQRYRFQYQSCLHEFQALMVVRNTILDTLLHLSPPSTSTRVVPFQTSTPMEVFPSSSLVSSKETPSSHLIHSGAILKNIKKKKKKKKEKLSNQNK